MFEFDDAAAEALLSELAGDQQPGWTGPLRIAAHGDDLEPMWRLEGGVPVLADDLTDAQRREASEHAAIWSQREVDDVEVTFRAHDVGRTKALLVAYRTSLMDAGIRCGAEQSSRGSQAALLFFKQTAAEIGRRPGWVAHRIDTAETLERRLPATWLAYLHRATTWEAVDLAVAATDGMTGDDAWAAFDAAAEVAVVSTPLTTLKKKLRKIREQVQRKTADERARTTFLNRRATVEQGHDGEGSYTLTGPIEDIAAIETSVRLAAVAAKGCEGEARTLAQLQYDVAKDLILDGIKLAADPDRTDLAVPNRKGVTPKVIVTVPVLTLLGQSDEPGRLEGYGPIAPETARRIAADAPSFHRLLTHPVTGVVLDLDRTTYVPPADLRLWVKLRDETCRFPGCNRPAHLCDVDHADEWNRGGVTRAANLVSLCRPDHNGKSTGLTTEQLRVDGVVDWTTLWGRTMSDPPPDPFESVPDELLEDCPF